ncbi:MAG: hypothetical protein AUH72_08525 [Acidobacteria bacterium 13_1_40CM_4_65_8]|nr:MAG: hypothetical protein AUH72_08525 [Acidobacteria bacterium 13_1_40CM_4_65_8]
MLFASYAYFYQAGGWNQNSRFNLVRAITNDRSLQVDPYHRSTGDQALFDGHYYSDKAPGLSFAALPIVAIARVVLHARGGDAESYEGIALLSWLATVFTAGLFTALAAVTLFNLCLELDATPSGALFAALTFGLATPMWPLATLFIGHAFSAACLVFAFAAATRIGVARLTAFAEATAVHRPPSRKATVVRRSFSEGGSFTRRWKPSRLRSPAKTASSAEARRSVFGAKAARYEAGLGLVVGLAAGWATVSEFPAAVPAVVLAIYAAINAWPLGRERALRILGALVAGAAACAAVLMAYQYACFGSPFHIAYSSEQSGFEGMQTGVFGIHVPSIAALWRILFGRYRGLLPLAPALMFAPLGLIAMIRTPARRAAIVAMIIAVYYVLLNASYTYWEGGWSYGPRHLSPAIPFLCLGLARLWTIAPRSARAVLAGFSAYGAALSLVGAATMAQPPASFQRPLTELLLPAFRDGDLSLNTQRFTDSGASALRAHVDPKAAWNLGMKAGLDGHASLIPLAIVWLVASLLGFTTGRLRCRGPKIVVDGLS